MIETTTRRTPALLFALLFLISASFALTGCNTVEGAGQDIEAAGGAISDTAEDTKEELSD